MIKDHWYCIAGIHALRDGQLAAVWLGHDKPRDTVHVFDCVVMRRSVPVVIAERLNAGDRRWIPIAWHKEAEAMAEKLLLCGCNTEPDPVVDTDEAAEVASRSITERMISERFKVDRSLEKWTKEFESFRIQDNKIPSDTHPLMAATRHAVSMLEYARRKPKRTGAGVNYPRLAIV